MDYLDFLYKKNKSFTVKLRKEKCSIPNYQLEDMI